MTETNTARCALPTTRNSPPTHSSTHPAPRAIGLRTIACRSFLPACVSGHPPVRPSANFTVQLPAHMSVHVSFRPFARLPITPFALVHARSHVRSHVTLSVRPTGRTSDRPHGRLSTITYTSPTPTAHTFVSSSGHVAVSPLRSPVNLSVRAASRPAQLEPSRTDEVKKPVPEVGKRSEEVGDNKSRSRDKEVVSTKSCQKEVVSKKSCR